MENFEYSIQLNDRDWVEFYLASEECSLMQAALATAEEPLPNDLEAGEAEENRPIRVRVGPGPAPRTARCLPRGTPQGHLLAEEVLPAAIRGGQPSRVALEPSGGQHELPKLTRECKASLATEGRDPETGDRLAHTACFLPEADVAFQQAEFRGQISGQEAMERPACSVLMRAGASTGTGGQAEHGSKPPGLALQEPTNNISQAASGDIQLPLLVGSNAIRGNPESPELENQSVRPTSSSFPSGKSEGAEHPDTGSTEHFQVNVKAEAPSAQGKASPFQGHLVPPIGTSAPSDPLPESHREGLLGSSSHEEENVADLKGKGRADQREDPVHSILREAGQVDQEISSAGCPRPTIVLDSSCSGTVDQHRETAVLKAESQKDGIEELCHHLGPVVPCEGGTPSMAQGRQRSNFSEDNIPYGLAPENSPEGNVAEMTPPPEYDPFVCGNTPEQAEKMQDGVTESRLASDIGQDLPEMYGPEMYEYFFTDMDGAQVGDSAREKKMGLEIPSSPDHLWVPSASSQDLASIAVSDATHISIPEVYEHFFDNGGQDRKSWKRIFLSVPASEAKKVVRVLKSLLSKPAHFLRRNPSSPGTLLQRGSHGKLLVFSPRLMKESRPRPEDLRMAVMSPERPLQLAFTHRDMCLGFVAFASWTVKTSNLQGPDAWKIVLLANFGTFSAIRYFRRQIVAEGEHST